jgi:hypothetical protein
LVVALALTGVALLVEGTWWARDGAGSATALPALASPSPSPSPSVSPSGATTEPADADWRGIVAGLAALRARALATDDLTLLAGVYAPGSAPLAGDRATLEALAARRLRVERLAITTLRAQPVVLTPTEVTLRVTDAVSAYALVDATGHRVRRVPARGPRTYAMVLVPSRNAWQIKEIRR